MSWISGLADKAENILNKLDQNAATALQTPLSGESAPTTFGMSVPTTMQNIPSTIIKKSKSSSMLSLTTPLSSPAKQTSFNDVACDSAGFVASNAVKAPFETVANREWPTRQDVMSPNSYLVSPKTDVAIDMDVDSVNDVITTSKLVKESPRKAVAKCASQNVGAYEEILALRIAMAELKSERDILRTSPNSDDENAGLRQNNHELELLIESLTAERNQAQCRLEESELACSRYMHTISELSANLADLKQEYHEVAQKLQMQTKETAKMSKDLQEYRVKAHRALQIKDSLISELKASCKDGAVVPGDGDVENVHLLQIEIESLKQEQQHLRDEISTLLDNLKKVKNDLVVMEEQNSEMITTNRTNADALSKALSLEKEHSLQLESEQRVISQELNSLRQQLITASRRLQEREQFIQELKTEQKARVASVEIDDCNLRIRSLTQALVDKQNSLEQITADRNAMRIQLEKVQDQLQQSLFQNKCSSNSVQRNVLLSNTTDDVKAQLPLLMKETPFDNRVARRVKRAYSSLDSAGIRLGAFLRRYPLMRIFVLMYVGLLHIWVMFVLLSSTPS